VSKVSVSGDVTSGPIMSTATRIEWTEATWNPTTGCDRISPGCDNCYALTLAKRLKAMGQVKYQRDGDPRTSGPGFGVTMHEDALLEPLRWRKPRKVFVNSMSDIGHARISAAFVAKVFAVMALSPQHSFQVLTKRPRRLATMLSGFGVKSLGLSWFWHLLVSADSQAWSRNARENAEDFYFDVPEHTHPRGGKTCSSCHVYALAWRARMLASLPAAPPHTVMELPGIYAEGLSSLTRAEPPRVRYRPGIPIYDRRRS
jgi:hypothetical protein